MLPAHPLRRFARLSALLPALSALPAAAAEVVPPAGAHPEWPAPSVTITEKDGKRVIDSNGIPAHNPGAFPNRGNPNAISAQKHHYEIPLKPQPAASPVAVKLGPVGVAVDGLPFDPGAAEFWNGSRDWQYEATSPFVRLGLDVNHAHVQPTGAYHYHGMPSGLVAFLRKQKGADTMLLVGWASDGYPIYAARAHKVAGDARSPLADMRPSYRVKKGERPAAPTGPGGAYDGRFVQDYEYVAGAGDLDECNGRTGVTPEFPQGTYYYVLTDAYPGIPRQLHGVPSPGFGRPPGGGPPRGRPGGGPGGGQGGPPRPPA